MADNFSLLFDDTQTLLFVVRVGAFYSFNFKVILPCQLVTLGVSTKKLPSILIELPPQIDRIKEEQPGRITSRR